MLRRKTSLIRLLAVPLAAVLATVFVTACSSGGKDDSSGGSSTDVNGCNKLANKETVTLGVGTTLIYSVAYVAQSYGFFAEENLDVKFTTISNPGDSLALINSGQLDAGFAGFSAGFFNSLDRGLKLKAVTSFGQYPKGKPKAAGIFVRSDLIDSGAVKSVKDLKGKTLGLAGGSADVANAGGYFIAELLATGGLTLKDVNITNVGIADNQTAFKTKAIDFAFVSSPYSTLLQQDGTAKPFGPDDLLANQTQGGLLFGPTLNEKRPDVGVHLIRALLKAAAVLTGEYQKDPKVVQALTAAGIKADVVAATPAFYFAPDLGWNKDTIEDFQKVFLAYGGLLTEKKPASFDTVTNEPLREKAVASMKECK